ncbi:retrotransposon gag domain-containing protein [Artemisia annua]|uniref:Retrotransposon gag domain-containing protein n=1 Tax=Artemisia annua TaxID=35608 RepID=A0A2U1KI99_ARTAN|nr:retrotransposon gag domain-containing protein [Artemisia annua]
MARNVGSLQEFTKISKKNIARVEDRSNNNGRQPVPSYQAGFQVDTSDKGRTSSEGIEVTHKWQGSPPLREESEKNTKQFCKFHVDHGHDTNQCIDLKKEIERAIRSGELEHLCQATRKRIGGKDVELHRIHMINTRASSRSNN